MYGNPGVTISVIFVEDFLVDCLGVNRLGRSGLSPSPPVLPRLDRFDDGGPAPDHPPEATDRSRRVTLCVLVASCVASILEGVPSAFTASASSGQGNDGDQ